MFNMLRLANLYIRKLIRGVLECYLIQSPSHIHKNHNNCYYYTGMDITCLYTSSWEFICEGVTHSLTHSLCPRHVERNHYVPLFDVDPIEC